MKSKSCPWLIAPAVLALAILSSQWSTVFAQGTAFTYQGQLVSGSAPVNGSYDLTFTLFNTNSSGAAIAGPVTNSATAVTNGLFTTTIDFGAGAFIGTSNWLEIAVRTNGSSTAFGPVAPRQQITPTPYAVFAESANSLPGLQVQPNANGAPNVIGGSPVNFVSNSVVGATISGGGATNYSIGLKSISYTNSVTANFGTVGGGVDNTASGAEATVGGGGGNTAGGGEATVPGGAQNQAMGNYSFAAGYRAAADQVGSFVWADNSSGNTFSDAVPNQFLIRATGGVGIGTSSTPPGGLIVASGGLGVSGASSPNYGTAQGVFIEKTATAGAVYAFNYGTDLPTSLHLNSPGGNVGIGTTMPLHLLQVGGAYCDGNTWSPSSDSHLKSGFEPVNAASVLAKVTAMPITSWHYTNDATTPHLGPMAQDFYAAFRIGADDKHISDVDEGGVALAAIQGLNQKLEKKDAEIKELEARLEKLEQLMNAGQGKDKTRSLH